MDSISKAKSWFLKNITKKVTRDKAGQEKEMVPISILDKKREIQLRKSRSLEDNRILETAS